MPRPLTAGYARRIGQIASRDSVQGAQGSSIFVPALKYSDLATATGASVSFSAPWGTVTRAVVMVKDLSLAGANDDIVVQLGDSGGVETSGYSGQVSDAGSNASFDGDGFELHTAKSAANSISGTFTVDLFDSSAFTYMGHGTLGNTSATRVTSVAGYKDLDGALTTITVGQDTGGTDNLDAGTIRIAWYGY